MRNSHVEEVLTRCVINRKPVLLVGPPGVGKTDIVNRVRDALGYDIIISHPVVSESTDAKGLPFPSEDKKSAAFLPYGDLLKAIRATKPTIWFLDDLGQATPSVQAAFMQLLLARRIGEHVIPDCVVFIAATNRKQDRAGVSGILEPVKSRFVTILNVEPHIEDWVDWAYDNSMPATLIAFLRWRSDLLIVHKPSANVENSPNPRTWANLGQLDNMDFPEHLQQEIFAGAVGAEAAGEYHSFKCMWRDMVSPDMVLLDPQSSAIPKEISTLYALASALANMATKENIGRIFQYAFRLKEASKLEVATFMLKSATRMKPEVKESGAYALSIAEGGDVFFM